MSCKQCCGIEEEFDADVAADDLADYQRHGPSHETALLLEELTRQGVAGQTLLDIGGGVGAIQLELLAAGLDSAVDVDASSAYLQIAREEATRRGYAGRISYLHGDFVALANGLETADIVTLDRVICCYDEMAALVAASARKAGKFYGLVYPRDVWWARLFMRAFNVWSRWRKRNFRIFIHSTSEVEKILSGLGLRKTFEEKSLIWQVALFSPQSG